MRLSVRRGWTAALLTLFPALAAQEPPPPEGGEPPPEEQQEEKTKDDQEDVVQEDVVQEPPPSPEDPAPQAETPKPEVPTPDETVAPVSPVPEPSASPAPSAPSHPTVVWPLSFDAIEEHLRGLAALHPAVAVLEVLGRSAGGREILALRLGVRDALPGVEKPVLFLADYQGSASAGPEAALELAWQLAEGFERDERVRALLTQATLVIAPALDPDVRAPSGGALSGGTPAASGARSAVRFERNFPSGWQPETVRPGAGRISLSQPETLAAARALTNLKGCAVLLGFAASAPRGAPYPEAELPAADRAVFERLAAALELEGVSALVPWFELDSPGGGLFDFAYQARGIYPLLFTLPAEEELAVGGLSAFSTQVVARVLRCLTLLPRVEIAQEGLERLASDTWQLDVRIQNVGIVPTSSALVRHRDPLADVTLRLDGAKLVATAKKPASGANYTDASFQVRAPLSGGTLAGGEGRWLRLFLEASAGGEVRVTAVSAWAGSDAIQVVLP